MDFFERQELEDQGKNEEIERKLNESRREDEQKKQADSKREQKKANLPKVSSALTAFTEIEMSKDWVHFLVITFSIIADAMSLVPYLGVFTGIFFSVIFYVLYFLTGRLKTRAVAKMVVSGLAYFLESIGGIFLISLFPLFTVSAVLIYWLDLSYRKENKKQ